MTLEIWLAFAAASAVLLAIPGPTVLLVVSYALGHGRGSGWATVPGVTLGDFTAMTVSLLGAGAVLAASADLFSALKIAGAAYLVYLGIRLWRAPTGPIQATAQHGRETQWRMFANAYVVTALNPKSIVFFVAFLPHFVDLTQPALPQFIVLETTFLALAAINVTLWALLAGQMRRQFQQPATVRLLNRIGSGLLIGAAALTAAIRQ